MFFKVLKILYLIKTKKILVLYRVHKKKDVNYPPLCIGAMKYGNAPNFVSP